MSRGRTACSRKPFSGHVGTTSITVRAYRASLERHETPDPWRSDAVKARIQCVRRATGSPDPVRPAAAGNAGAGLWYGCDALACRAELRCGFRPLDRKAVRIAQGYLRFITEGCRVSARAGMRRGGIAGFATQRGRSGRDPDAPGPCPLSAA